MSSQQPNQNAQPQEGGHQLTREALNNHLAATEPISQLSTIAQASECSYAQTQAEAQPQMQARAREQRPQNQDQDQEQSDPSSELSDFDQDELEGSSLQCDFCGTSLLPDQPNGPVPEYCRSDRCGMPSGMVNFGDWTSFIGE